MLKAYFSITHAFCVFETTQHNLCSIKITHQTQSNLIHRIVFGWQTQSWVPFSLICLIEFNQFGNRTHTTFSVWIDLIAKLNQTQFAKLFFRLIKFDWVCFPNIWLTIRQGLIHLFTPVFLCRKCIPVSHSTLLLYNYILVSWGGGPKHRLWKAFVDGLIDNDEK